jgi:hypothetical protein
MVVARAHRERGAKTRCARSSPRGSRPAGLHVDAAARAVLRRRRGADRRPSPVTPALLRRGHNDGRAVVPTNGAEKRPALSLPMIMSVPFGPH